MSRLGRALQQGVHDLISRIISHLLASLPVFVLVSHDLHYTLPEGRWQLYQPGPSLLLISNHKLTQLAPNCQDVSFCAHDLPRPALASSKLYLIEHRDGRETWSECLWERQGR